MGRRKIEIKMVEDSDSRQVTFSKRRQGIFKKANELATLCAAEVAIVVFSPGGKPFSFGHPSFESVAQRFLNEESNKASCSHTESCQAKARVDKLEQQLNDLLKQLRDEEKRGEMLHKVTEENGANKYHKNVNELNPNEIMEFQSLLEDLRKKLKERVSEIDAASSLLLLSKDAAAKENNKKRHKLKCLDKGRVRLNERPFDVNLLSRRKKEKMRKILNSGDLEGCVSSSVSGVKLSPYQVPSSGNTSVNSKSCFRRDDGSFPSDDDATAFCDDLPSRNEEA